MVAVKWPSARLSRDTILFGSGLAGLAYETISKGAEKPTLIVAFVGMLGLPLFIRGDEARKADAAEKKTSEADRITQLVTDLTAAAKAAESPGKE